MLINNLVSGDYFLNYLILHWDFVFQASGQWPQNTSSYCFYILTRHSISILLHSFTVGAKASGTVDTVVAVTRSFCHILWVTTIDSNYVPVKGHAWRKLPIGEGNHFARLRHIFGFEFYFSEWNEKIVGPSIPLITHKPTHITFLYSFSVVDSLSTYFFVVEL